MSSSYNLPAIPVDRAAYYRAFSVGPALIQPEDRDPAWGRLSEEFTPTVYGEYAARSLPIFAAIRFRAANMGKLIAKTFREQANGELEETQSPALRQLVRRPNPSPYWTFRKLLRFIEWDRCLWGQSMIVLERGGSGTGPVREIWRVRPDKMRPVLDPVDYIVAWIYEHEGNRLLFRASEVLWLPFDNPIDEFSGLSPVAPLRLSVDTMHEAMRSNAQRMRYGMRPSAVLSPDTQDMVWNSGQIEQITQQIKSLYSGPENAGKTLILSGGAKLQPWALSNADMEYLEQLRWSLNDAARAYGIPPELLGDHEHATYSNVEQAEKAVWTDTLIPEADDLADQLTAQLLPLFPDAGDLLRLDYSMIDVLQEDRTEITHQASAWIDRGVPLNRALQEFAPNLLPTAGDGYEWGDVPIWEAKAQFQMDQFGGEGEPGQMMGTTKGQSVGQDDSDDENPARSLRRMLERERTRMIEYGSEEHQLRWRRWTRQTDRREQQWETAAAEMFRRQQESVLARLRNRSRDAIAAESAPFDPDEWLGKWRQLGFDLMTDTFSDAAMEALDEIGVSSMFDLTNPLVTQWLQQRAQRFAQRVNDTTWNDLQKTLSEGIDAGEGIDDLAERIKKIFKEASDGRARMIARTETIAASNAGGLEAARQSGVVRGKTWFSALDERVRPSHTEAHGQLRGLDEEFVLSSGATGLAPGQMGMASEDVNCRCTMLWALEDGRIIPSVVIRS